MAKPDLGEKHICDDCGAKFYDLNKTPAVCPKCGTKAARAPAPAPAPAPAKAAKPAPVVEKVVAETDKSAAAAGVEIVSLDDAEDDSEDDETDGIEDIEMDDDDTSDDDDDDDDTFLEPDEEDETDVSGLIGGGIGSDKEDS